MTTRDRTVALMVIALSLCHAPLGFLDIRIPAWAMFRHADRYEYVLVDAHGRRVSIRDYVQQRAYVICDYHMVQLVARWLVDTNRVPTPLRGRVTVWHRTTLRPPADVESIEFEIYQSHTGAVPRIVSRRRS